MRYKYDARFEEIILGRHRSDVPEINFTSFDEAIAPVIWEALRTGYKHPDTDAGELLYYGVKSQLQKMGISPNGLAFVPAIGTSADRFYKTDAIFYLPSIPKFFIMIDLFNLDTEFSITLRDLWEKDYQSYPEEFFQSDLFVYKGGLASSLKKEEIDVVGWTRIFKPKDDFWREAPTENGPKGKRTKTRKINHFILIPEYIIFREKRLRFCKMIADCFRKRIGGTKT